jgi:hypothetical protein
MAAEDMVMVSFDGSARSAGAGVVAAASLLALLSACGPTIIAIPPDQPVTHARTTPNPTASPTTSATPEPTSGPLRVSDLPIADVLGKRWKTYVEPGGFGVVGNGSYSRARQIDDLMAGLVPVGCPPAALEVKLPRPAYALEGSYRDNHESPGVSLVLEFGNDSDAKAFLHGLDQQFDTCPPGNRDANGPLTLDFQTLAMRSGRIAAIRQEHGQGADPNRYLVVAAAAGRRVGVVYVGAGAPSDRDRIGRKLADWIAG